MEKIQKTQKTGMAYYLDQARQLVFAILVVLAIRSSVMEPFKIPSGSMYPTLYVGDFIFVNKFAYALKLPFSDYFGMKPINLITRDPPKKGDIAVFLFPKDPSIHFIKRITAIAGDTVELKNKVLYINNVAQNQVAIDENARIEKIKDMDDEKYGTSHIQILNESLSGHEHKIMLDQNNTYEDAPNVNFPATVVPEGHVFAMGDNRDFSNDSRFWGFVPYENISGRAELIWFWAWVNTDEIDKSIFKPSRIGSILSKQ